MKPRAFVVSKDAAYTSCAYTVIPVIHKRLLDLPYHISRVKQSFALLNGDADSLKCCDNLIAESCLKSLLSNDAKDGLLTVCIGLTKSPESDDGRNSDSFAADSLFYEMPSNFLSVQPDGLAVDLQQYTRGKDPRIKGSSWPAERYHLENNRHKQASETIMCSSQTRTTSVESSVDLNKRQNDHSMLLTEGLTSNFFACEDDCLITAPDGLVLSGSMARIVIAAAQALGVTVHRRSPELSLIKECSWSSAFLTSATRPMHDIKSVLGPKGDKLFEPSNKCDTTAAIKEAVNKIMRDQENTFLQKYIPYPLWSPPITPSSTIDDLMEIFQSDFL